ncbi:MAG: class I SAM-dependent methyltransferase [Patescibacteria group bacterium]
MLKFTPLEKLKVHKPVDRLLYISQFCKNKKVLDIGCYDETAIKLKKNNGYWLHGLISREAKKVIGIDSSELIKSEIRTGQRSKIIRKDLYYLDRSFADANQIDLIVAGELIEHIPDVSKFFQLMKKLYPKKILLLTTPNATSLTNVLLAFFNRESNHKDHIQIFSYKTLHALCIKNGFKKFKIIPYNVKFTEMYLSTLKTRRYFIKLVERIINFCENIFPMLSGGYILKIELK